MLFLSGSFGVPFHSVPSSACIPAQPPVSGPLAIRPILSQASSVFLHNPLFRDFWRPGPFCPKLRVYSCTTPRFGTFGDPVHSVPNSECIPAQPPVSGPLAIRASVSHAASVFLHNPQFREVWRPGTLCPKRRGYSCTTPRFRTCCAAAMSLHSR